MTVALLLVGILVPAVRHEAFSNTTPWLSVRAALTLVNAFLLAGIVIPAPAGTNVATPRTDFVQMVTLPWMRAEQIDAFTTQSAGMEFQRLVVLKDYQAAYDEARRVLDVDPGNWMVRAALSELLLFAGLHAEAATHYDEILRDGMIPEKAIHPGVRALLANNAAWNLFSLHDPHRIADADRLSAQALAVLPKHPSVLGTRGAVLVEAGDLAEGQKLLRLAHRRHGDRAMKAINSACLAIAAARVGKPLEARRLLDRARKEDEECELLDRAESELGGQKS